MVQQKVLIKTQDIEIVEFNYSLAGMPQQEVIYTPPITAALDQAVDVYVGARSYSHYIGGEDNESKFFKRLIVISNIDLN